jgi:hypothetical protein
LKAFVEVSPMASLKFPLTVEEKQKVQFIRPAPSKDLKAWGDRYRGAGLLHDALEFYQAAKDRDSLLGLVDSAIQAADLVLLLNIYRALGSEPDAARLQDLRQKALALGKEAAAAKASSLLIPAR